MSVRSHIASALIPLLLVGATTYWLATSVSSKSLEINQVDIWLSKSALRSCGVERLRSMGTEVVVKDNSLGGLLVQLPGPPPRDLTIQSISEHRTRIETSWRNDQDSPAVRAKNEEEVNKVAELLVQCKAS
jgi:hypothetical protein